MQAPSETVGVLVVEDHGVVRAGLAAVFEHTPEFRLIGAVDNGKEALSAVERLQPDLIILDLRLPDMSGLEVLRHLRAAGSRAKPIVLSSHDSAHTIRQALALDARAYVVKRAGVPRLVEALRAVAAGRTYLSPEATAALAEQSEESALSARELQILRLAAKGMTNAQIGEQLSITARTVKFHINSVLQKLNAADRTHAVAIALQRGMLEL